jgi:hypothetical protein
MALRARDRGAGKDSSSRDPTPPPRVRASFLPLTTSDILAARRRRRPMNDIADCQNDPTSPWSGDTSGVPLPDWRTLLYTELYEPLEKEREEREERYAPQSATATAAAKDAAAKAAAAAAAQVPIPGVDVPIGQYAAAIGLAKTNSPRSPQKGGAVSLLSSSPGRKPAPATLPSPTNKSSASLSPRNGKSVAASARAPASPRQPAKSAVAASSWKAPAQQPPPSPRKMTLPPL